MFRFRSRTCRTALSAAAAIALAGDPDSASAATTSGAAPPERIAVNDNRIVAGTFANGTLTVHLEVRTGVWYPEADADGAVTVKAFAVEGRPLQIPGPLIRVVEGTEIRVRVRNRLDDEQLVLHGLYSRPARAAGARPTFTIPAGEVREIRFVAGAPGTYFYWGA